MIVVIVAALIGVVALSLSKGAGPGRPAPALPKTVLVPPAVTLASLHGKPAAVNFWASWCTPCKQEAPALEQVARSLHGQAHLVGVNWTDGVNGARAYVKRYGWTFPSLRDSSGAVGNKYGLTGLPETFILDARGRITQVPQGPQSVSSLRAALGAAS